MNPYTQLTITHHFDYNENTFKIRGDSYEKRSLACVPSFALSGLGFLRS